MPQKVMTAKTSEPTAQEYMDSLKTNKGRMDLLNESLGFAPEPAPVDEAPAPEPKKEEPAKPVEPVVEAKPEKEKEPEKVEENAAAKRLAEALGVHKVELPQDTTQKDKLDKFDELQKRNAELERKITIQEEEGAYKNLLATLTEAEAKVVLEEIVELVKSEDYKNLGNMTVEKRTAWTFGNAKTLAGTKLDKIKADEKAKHEENERTMREVISGPAATETGGQSDAEEIKALQKRAADGDEDAATELIFRNTPGAAKTFERILKDMKE